MQTAAETSPRIQFNLAMSEEALRLPVFVPFPIDVVCSGGKKKTVSQFILAYVEATPGRAHHPTCPWIETREDWRLLRRTSPSCRVWPTAAVCSLLMNSNQPSLIWGAAHVPDPDTSLEESLSPPIVHNFLFTDAEAESCLWGLRCDSTRGKHAPTLFLVITLRLFCFLREHPLYVSTLKEHQGTLKPNVTRWLVGEG